MRKTLAIAIPAYERTSGIELNILSNIDFFLEKGFQVKELRFIDKFYNRLEKDTSNIYYLILVKAS